MSSSGPRFHIPFPSNFLSLNTPSHNPSSSHNNASATTISSNVAVAPHSFLSNRPAVPRHASVSSVSSVSSTDSAVSAPSAASAAPADAAGAGAKGHAFLPLNAKRQAPPASAKEMRASTSSGRFLSNVY